MAEGTALSEEKARLLAETEAQRGELRRQCRDLQFAATLVERGHQVALTAFQARKKLNPVKSLFSKRSWLSPSGFMQNAQSIMGLVATVKNAFAPRASRICIEEEEDDEMEISHTRRF